MNIQTFSIASIGDTLRARADGIDVNRCTVTPDEVALLTAFRAIASDGRSDALCIMRALAEAHPCARPALMLVRGSQRQKEAT